MYKIIGTAFAYDKGNNDARRGVVMVAEKSKNSMVSLFVAAIIIGAIALLNTYLA